MVQVVEHIEVRNGDLVSKIWATSSSVEHKTVNLGSMVQLHGSPPTPSSVRSVSLQGPTPGVATMNMVAGNGFCQGSHHYQKTV